MGRGYGFEVIRARVLIERRTVDVEEMVACDGCSISFAKGMLVAMPPASIGRGKRKRILHFCPNCQMYGPKRDVTLQRHSTLQSG